ncbi:pyridoxal phosphate-dependent aminotransferase [Stigmatella sp. ncwal1]|uniref:Pyridoxal phosphate-dependent aminotransferase n=1 Tax=Stigmatella ashevillensis TaxID=2995309 RepID=A0ABT5CZP4_9BACT|nr:pyridoxal phosphate-dependent aminotransferase [Stigmatella ashevillena]MDC0706889.1 pyridoxal phosphate-dependent aminotransferase [Stigmatella ashevillena]
MRPSRMMRVVGFNVDRVVSEATTDPEVLRLENFATDLPPPPDAIAATREAVGASEANSYVPFTGTAGLRQAVASRLKRQSNLSYDPDRQIVITAGGTQGLISALLAVIEPGDEVLLTDPTYAGMIHRVTFAGGVPMFVPMKVVDKRWRLDLDMLRAMVTSRTRAMVLSNPGMPSGHVLSEAEWLAIRELCVTRNLWLLYDAALEGVLYDGLPLRHPASLTGMPERTLIIGSISKEYRMIGWRIGWIAGPPKVMADVFYTHSYLVIAPPGISQKGAEVALRTENSGVQEAISEWKARRDLMLEQLEGLPVVIPDGGWSMLLDAHALGYSATDAASILLTQAKVAATPMTNWGSSVAERYIRLVFSFETRERLKLLRDRLRRTSLLP